jgi:protein ImuA
MRQAPRQPHAAEQRLRSRGEVAGVTDPAGKPGDAEVRGRSMSPATPVAALDQLAVLATLRARVARLEGAGRASHGTAAIPVAEGLPLPGGGLARAAMHEVLAASPGCGAAFCALLLARTGGTVFWIAAGRGGLLAWPHGLAQFGLAPANLIIVRAEHWPDALWAMEEALRCPAVTGALLALDPELASGDSPLDLTATRRLQLAAETGGALGLLLRPDMAVLPHTAAASRWRVGSLGAGRGLENPRWQLELLRLRGGRPGGPWAVTWRAASGQLELDREAATSDRPAGRSSA